MFLGFQPNPPEIHTLLQSSGGLGWNPKNIEHALFYICVSTENITNTENIQSFIRFFNQKYENFENTQPFILFFNRNYKND